MSNDEDGDGNGAEDETEEIGYWLCVNSWKAVGRRRVFQDPRRGSEEGAVWIPAREWGGFCADAAMGCRRGKDKEQGRRSSRRWGDGACVWEGADWIGVSDRISVDVVEQRRGRGERECGDVKARFAVKGANMFKTPHLQCRLDNVMSSGVEWVSPSEIVCVFSSLKDSWVLCGAGKGVQKERR
ncbi:uncharacterized protein MONOS_18454 [Monocercomonoides exilis]|uniref:uncharacterized protein n=1 Tax=Monocercomonoides exilis TaxID=2049356 RepID=UPI00355A6946|nr:hypothetical protein MONOS_18454 [Monocercomonoides exilis]